MKTKPRDRAAPPAATTAANPPPWQRRAVLALTLASLVLAAAVVWAIPREVGDLYVGLAGGQDVLEGRLGRPDTWSFTTGDRVWIDQNWLTHLVHYLVYRGAGQTGLLATKAVTIALLALGMALAARRRGASWPAGLLTVAGVLVASKAYIDLRPNLITLTLAPWMLCLLLLSRRRVYWVWPAAALAGLWANMHGGFVLGLGMLGLWTACHGLTAWAAGGFLAAWRRYWPLAAGTVAAIVLAGLANPFGLENLTHGLVVGRSSAWREIDEWRPIWMGHWQLFGGSLWEFLAVLGLTAGLSAARLLARRRRPAGGAARPARPGVDDAALALFELVLLLGVVYMACAARRFMPLAMVLLTPFLARQLEWSLAPARRAWPVAAACLLLAAPTALLGGRIARYYRDDNPLVGPETFLERMVYHQAMMCPGVAEFINANDIQGRVFQEWRWEGYLRWRCPQLKLWVGGRAQQVYSEQEFRQRMAVVNRPQEAAAMLAALDVHLAVVPWGDTTGPLVRQLAFAPQASWAAIYYDGLDVVLADARHAATRGLVEQAAQGRLVWPDADSALLSRVACTTSTPVLPGINPTAAQELARRALEQCPTPILPPVLAELASRGGGTMPESEVQFLQHQYQRLSALPQPRPKGIAAVITAQRVAEVLATHYRSAGRLADAQDWAARAEAMRRRFDRLMKQYWIWN